jgi:hypothetical protein
MFPSTTPTLRLLRRQPHSPTTTPLPRPLNPAPPIIQIINPRLNVLINPLRHTPKRLFHTLPTLRARLHILQHAVPLRPLRRLLRRHFPLIPSTGAVATGLARRLRRQVAFIPNQNDNDVLIGDRPQILQPVLHVQERGAPRDIKDQQRARRAAEIGPRDGFVGFLAGGVPEAELEVLLRLRGRFWVERCGEG